MISQFALWWLVQIPGAHTAGVLPHPLGPALATAPATLSLRASSQPQGAGRKANDRWGSRTWLPWPLSGTALCHVSW